MTDASGLTVEADDVVVVPPAADLAGADLAGDARQHLAARLVAEAEANGVGLVGPGGLLAELTKQVLELGLEVEMAEHLGYASTTRRAGTGATRATGSGPRR